MRNAVNEGNAADKGTAGTAFFSAARGRGGKESHKDKTDMWSRATRAF